MHSTPSFRVSGRRDEWFRCLFLSLGALLCAVWFTPSRVAAASAQELSSLGSVSGARRPDHPSARSAALRTDVKLVLIPVTVTDQLQRPVLGLARQNFHVFEDRVEQKISEFYSEEAPVSIGMVLDASNSMRKKIDQSRQALNDFLSMSMPGDEFSLLKFSDRPQTLCSFTTSVGEIEDNLAAIQSGGWTSLFDALYLAMNQMKKAAHGTRALFVLSDGGDNNSRYTESEILSMVREADVRIFSISILDRSPSLERISEESGGRGYRVRRLSELTELAATLSAEIHSHYVIGYAPETLQRDGKYHRIVVKLVPPEGSPKLRVAWRHGYYGPLH